MIRNYLMDLLFPPKCILCGKLLKKDETDLCRVCRVESPGCAKNNLKFPFLDSWAAVWYYKGNIRKSLHRYKFRNARHYAPAYGRFVAMKLMQEHPEGFDILPGCRSADGGSLPAVMTRWRFWQKLWGRNWVWNRYVRWKRCATTGPSPGFPVLPSAGPTYWVSTGQQIRWA